MMHALVLLSPFNAPQAHAVPDAAAASPAGGRSTQQQQQPKQRKQPKQQPQPQPPPHAQQQQQAQAPAGAAGGSVGGLFADNPTLLRRLMGATSAADALDALVQQGGGGSPAALSEADAEQLLTGSLEQGNVALARSLYQEMCRVRRMVQAAGGAASASIDAAPLAAWPPATLALTARLVLGLCRQLQVAQAREVIEAIRGQGMPRAEEVAFGYVVPSPLPPRLPLAVAQPREGCRVVADANTRYEFELFSGTVSSCKSEALNPGDGGLLAAAARAVGLLRTQAVAAVHEWVVTAPDGTSRTFRAGTSSADVPAQPGERVSVVCAPSKPSTRQRRLLLSTAPPGTRPGQPLLVANHRTGAELALVRPPSGPQGLPGWALPVTVLLAGSDAASALVDPSLPLLLATGVAVAVGSAVAGNSLVLPRLKQLPPKAVRVEETRQQLLAQHGRLAAKVKATLQVGVCARRAAQAVHGGCAWLLGPGARSHGCMPCT